MKDIKKKAKPIMIQGTASSSGKSLITAALCRIFYQDGYRVAPFKAQNMSNNSFVTIDGLEMGRAQAVQAFAAGLEPDSRMNPVLLKPSSSGSQVILCGKIESTINAHNWLDLKDKLRYHIHECYHSLSSDFEIIVIEGAGNPAEINLKRNDIVNMGMAKMADSPVVIVGDIDRGGVFASLVGTMALLDPEERDRVKGFIINKFRGDVDLLKPGLEELEKITGVPVIGVVPWINHSIDEEDGVSTRFDRKESQISDIDICIIRLPHISNYTDFIPLERVPGVTVRWCDTKNGIGKPDLLIIPGTKATIADLQLLKKTGISEAVLSYAKNGGTVLGICGGFQMLGNMIYDPHHSESSGDREEGLHLLDMQTVFSDKKQTETVSVSINNDCSWLFANCSKVDVQGYEIHMGQSEYGKLSKPFTQRCGSGNQEINGITDQTGKILGTYLHGLFDSAEVTVSIINAIRSHKGLLPLQSSVTERKSDLNKDLDLLAETIRNTLDINVLYRILGLE